jgi:hypothetical protein
MSRSRGRCAQRRRFGALGVSELRELRQLRDENRKLKGLVADPDLRQDDPARGAQKRMVRPGARRALVHWAREGVLSRFRRSRCSVSGRSTQHTRIHAAKIPTPQGHAPERRVGRLTPGSSRPHSTPATTASMTPSSRTHLRSSMDRPPGSGLVEVPRMLPQPRCPGQGCGPALQ